MSTPTGAELLVKSLEAQGVEYVFGIPGAKIDKVFDTLLDSRIKTVVSRHEQNAAFIAGGIGRMTGKAGVTLVTSGNCAQTPSDATAVAPQPIKPAFALFDRHFQLVSARLEFSLLEHAPPVIS